MIKKTADKCCCCTLPTRNWHINKISFTQHWFDAIKRLYIAYEELTQPLPGAISALCLLVVHCLRRIDTAVVSTSMFMLRVVHCLRGIEKVNIRMTKRPVAYHVVCLFSWKRKNHAPEFFGSIFFCDFFWFCGNFLKYRFHINSEEEMNLKKKERQNHEENESKT